MMPRAQVVGKSVTKIDAAEKVVGSARFTVDLTLPHMLYAKVLRSPYPHARIISIDTSAAEALPGVKAVATYKNTPQVPYNGSLSEANPPAVPVNDEMIFSDRVRYVGDEVAAVAATSEAVAAAALALIKVEYEQLPAVFDPLQAMGPDAPEIHPCFLAKNLCGIAKLPLGDIGQGFAESDIVIEERYQLPVVKHAQLETQAAVASVTPEGRIEVWSTTQSPHPLKNAIAHIFGVPASKVRVQNPPYVGGAFGAHVGMSAKAELLAVALSKLAGRPVKMVYDRKEDFIASTTRHGGYLTVKLGAKLDGTFTALFVSSVLNTGAYADAGPDVTAVLGVTCTSIYRIPHIFYDGACVYTNTTPAGAMRGFGSPQGNFAVECTVEKMAEALSVDPIELRMKNIIQPFDNWLPPYPCASSGLAECIEKGAKAIDWQRRYELKKPVDNKVRGIGMAVGAYLSNSWPFAVEFDNAYLAMQEDGSLNLSVGVPEIGQGISTTLSQLAAEGVGATFDKVSIHFGDTASSAYDIGSHASRTLYCAGTAVCAAAADLKQQILGFAGQLMECPPENITIRDNVLSHPGGRMTLAELAHKAHRANKQFVAIGQTVPFNAPPFQAHFAEVEVDLTTGQTEVIKFVAAHDVGRAIHPQIVEGQVHGAVMQGVGYALSEEIRYDDKGRQAQDSFHKYYLPTIEETPEIEVILVESHEPSGPFGAKGVGECGLVPSAAAIASAIHNATGCRFHAIPITEERLFRALQAKNKGGK